MEFPYQPNYFDPTEDALRKGTTIQRFNLIKPFIKEGSDLLDMGCNRGYFCYAAASECKCGHVCGVDKYDISSLNARDRHGLANLDFESIVFPKDRGTIFDIHWDVILNLSVWHYVMRDYGAEKSDDYLRALSDVSDSMFIEFAHNLEPHAINGWERKNLPIGPPEEWQGEYFLTRTSYKKVEVIGNIPCHGSITRPLWRLFK